MNAIAEVGENEFDRFLAAIKLLAEAAEMAVDFDDFAYFFESSGEHPLYDDNPSQFLHNVQNTLEEGLGIIFMPMGLGCDGLKPVKGGYVEERPGWAGMTEDDAGDDAYPDEVTEL